MKNWAGLSGIFLASILVGKAEVDDEVPLGIEAVTGFRSAYIFRGYELAQSSLDFQMEAELVISDQRSLHFGFSHLAENSSDFSESTSYLELSHEINSRLTTGVALTYRDRNASILADGLELGIYASWAINKNWRWRNELSHDLGVEGTHFASELEWSMVLSDKAFLAIEGGVNFLADYPERDGLSDFYTRLALTYALSDQISFTPFVGSSVQIEDDAADDAFYAGLWFEVIF